MTNTEQERGPASPPLLVRPQPGGRLRPGAELPLCWQRPGLFGGGYARGAAPLVAGAGRLNGGGYGAGPASGGWQRPGLFAAHAATARLRFFGQRSRGLTPPRQPREPCDLDRRGDAILIASLRAAVNAACNFTPEGDVSGDAQ